MQNKEQGARGEFEKKAVFVVKAGLLAFAAYTLLSMSLAPFSSLCSRCHSEVGSSHEAAGHAQVSCNSCHSGSTTAERLNFRISIARMIPSAIFYGQPEGALVTNQTCDRCHAEQIRDVFVSATQIRISHAEKTAEGYQCPDCHATAGHSLSGNAVRQVDMFDCFSCHKTPEMGECELCHTEEVKRERRAYDSVWRLTHGEDWERLHGMGDIELCGPCHHPKYCTKCHAVEMPHPGDFLFGHGDVALEYDFEEGCADCHDEETFCLSCHQMEIPHPDGFLEAHSETPEEAEEQCLKCHDRVSCLYCHVEHTHPGVPIEEVRELRRGLQLD